MQAIDLGDADVIDAAVAHARTALIEEGLQMGLPSQPALRSARQAIFDPVEKCLRGRKRLFISPDGDIATLPFETLLTDSGQPLIDEYSFSYVTSGRDLQRAEDVQDRGGQIALVIVDPDYDLSSTTPSSKTAVLDRKEGCTRSAATRGIRFTPIPGTRTEGECVAVLLKTTAVSGANALERIVKTTRAPRVLHLATHGFFLTRKIEDGSDASSPIGQQDGTRTGQSRSLRDLTLIENPLLRSGLALAGANTWLAGGPLPEQAEDGMLTAEDVSGLNLFGTELVVLSACETGLGQVHAGEGVFGLRRAFALAGARTIVMSLWQIPDQETVELMRIFYERLLAGASPSHALRGAQQAIRTRLPMPFFWGAFICQGDDQPLSRQASQLLQG